jgi:hypothetical protein
VDKENGNRKRSTKGKVATERLQMERAPRGIITGLKLGIKKKRQEKVEKEGCMERK